MALNSIPIILSIVFGAIIGIAVIVLLIKITGSGRGIRRTFSINRFIVFIVLFGVALVLYPVLLNELFYSKFHQILLTVGFSAFLTFLLLFSFFAKCFYCSDCGQYLGHSGNVCPRCGCNIYTDEFAGIGTTIREGRKNY